MLRARFVPDRKGSARKLPFKWLSLLTATAVAAGCASGGSLAVHSPPPGDAAAAVKRVVFIGDSITGGWGFESDNYPIAGNLASLKACAQDPPPMDDCTNDEPGASTRKVGDGVPPWVAYPYQVRSMIEALPDSLPIENYAVSGATPAMWDPTVTGLITAKFNGTSYKSVAYECNPTPQDMAELNIFDPKWDGCDPNLFPGLYGTTNNPDYAQWNLTKLPADRSTLTVFTLGANPVMSRYLGLTLIAAGGVQGADTKIAKQAAATGDYTALDASFERNIQAFRVVEHLTNLLVYLADRGPVVLQKIYPSCPGMLGNTDTGGSPLTTAYATCKSKAMFDVAQRAVTRLNAAMDQAVANAASLRPDGDYLALCPGDDSSGTCDLTNGFAKHPQFENTKAYGGRFPENNPWILSNDTGVHPNAAGHRYLATGVIRGACREYRLFCDALGPDSAVVSTQWWPVRDKSCRATYYCAFAAVRNETGKTWKLSTMTQASEDPTWTTDGGEWVLLPPNEVKPGETLRYAIQSRHSGGGVGAKGAATYTIEGGSDQVRISTQVGLISNSWDLSTTNPSQYSATIDQARSKKAGSEEILNGTVKLK